MNCATSCINLAVGGMTVLQTDILFVTNFIFQSEENSQSTLEKTSQILPVVADHDQDVSCMVVKTMSGFWSKTAWFMSLKKDSAASA